MGGWIGGVLGMLISRHKIGKITFIIMYLAVTAANLVIWLYCIGSVNMGWMIGICGVSALYDLEVFTVRKCENSNSCPLFSMYILGYYFRPDRRSDPAQYGIMD